MATSFEHVQTYSADPAAVMAMLKDRDFIEGTCDKTGSQETTVKVEDSADGGCTITTTRVLPAPSGAESFVGSTLNVTETQVWTAPGPGGTATATVVVDFGAPITFKATTILAPAGASATVTTNGELKCGIPFVGGKFESGAAKQTSKYLSIQEALGNEWLASR